MTASLAPMTLETASLVELLPIALIDANPDQPRQSFEQEALEELAASIASEGLMQPIVVTPRGDRFLIIAGERRFRAHKLLGLSEIKATIERDVDDATVMLRAITENEVRRGVCALDSAIAYKRCLAMGLSLAEIARRCGYRAEWRVMERVRLLDLRDEYQQLLRVNAITTGQAIEMSTLSPSGQDRLFAKLKGGELLTLAAVRAAALAIRDEESQVALFSMDGPIVTEATRRRAKNFQQRLEQVSALLRCAINENEVVAVKKVDPNKASRAADLIAAMRMDLQRIEDALRSEGAGDLELDQSAA